MPPLDTGEGHGGGERRPGAPVPPGPRHDGARQDVVAGERHGRRSHGPRSPRGGTHRPRPQRRSDAFEIKTMILFGVRNVI